MLLIIEQWRADHGGKFPEEIYVQVDGGSENANRYVLAFFEFLVAKRMAKRVYYTRLPVGHTHEDIDACFALIWNWFKKVSISSVQQYKEEVEAALKDSKVPTKVVDIFVIPEYKAFFLPHIDTEIGYLHRLEDTQLQWRFEAVEVHRVHFPLGVKTTYRAYASDQVVKIRKLPKLQCSSRDGCLTGLEACTVLVRWEPAFDPQKGSMVEGTFLLKSMPGLNANESFIPASFVVGSAAHINETVQAAFAKWAIGTPEREKWSRWSSNEAPQSDDVALYLNSHYMRTPLKSFFFIGVFYGSVEDVAIPEVLENEYTFQWPVALAIANASVRTEHNLRPLPPYTYFGDANETNDVVSCYKIDSVAYYSVVLKGQLVTYLKKILSRKVQPTGDSVSCSGNKEDLLKRIFNWDIEVIRNISRPLSVADSAFVQKVLDYDPFAVQLVVEIHHIAVTRDRLSCCNEGQTMSLFIIGLFLKLFQTRDDTICGAHHEVNSSSRFFIPRKKSFFADPNILGQLLQNNETFSEAAIRYITSVDIFNMNKLYLPIYFFDEKRFELIVVDIQQNVIFYINPTIDDSIESVNWSLERRNMFSRAIMAMLRNFPAAPVLEDWPCKLYSIFPLAVNTERRGFDLITDPNDCGVYLIIMLDLLCNDLPLLFHRECINNMRKSYVYYLLKAEMPIQ